MSRKWPECVDFFFCTVCEFFSYLFMYHLVETGGYKRDVVFLLDGSDESRNGLPALREFIRRMADELDIDEDKVRVAVVQYSSDASVYFNLNSHSSKKAIIYAVRSLRHKGGRARNTGAALKYVRDNVFTASSGSRHMEGVPQILFLLTGGKSSDDVSGAAVELKQMGVLSFAIGMKNSDQKELQKIAFSPRFLFNLPVFGELLSVQPEIAAFVQAKIQIEPPTLVGKTCHSSILEINLTLAYVAVHSFFYSLNFNETALSYDEPEVISFMFLKRSLLVRDVILVWLSFFTA